MHNTRFLQPMFCLVTLLISFTLLAKRPHVLEVLLFEKAFKMCGFFVEKKLGRDLAIFQKIQKKFVVSPLQLSYYILIFQPTTNSALDVVYCTGEYITKIVRLVMFNWYIADILVTVAHTLHAS